MNNTKSAFDDGVMRYSLKNSGITLKKESNKPFFIILILSFIFSFAVILLVFRQYSPFVLLLPSVFGGVGLMLAVYGIYYTATHINLKLDLDFPKEKVDVKVTKRSREMIKENRPGDEPTYSERFTFVFDCTYNGEHYEFEKVSSSDKINGKKPKVGDTWVLLFEKGDPQYSVLEEDFKEAVKSVKYQGIYLIVFGIIWLALVVFWLVFKR